MDPDDVDCADTNVTGTPSWSIGVGVVTHVGMVRAENQDAFAYHDPDEPQAISSRGRLMVVCDGMGGHFGGSIASRTTSEALVESYYASDGTMGDPGDHLVGSVQQANAMVRDKGRENLELRQMGTTCVAAALLDDRIVFAHIGDSRIYRLRHGEISQITRDHTYVNELIDLGAIRPEEARDHPQRHVITRCVGMAESILVDRLESDVLEGDRFLLCTDGLYQHVEDDEMLELVQRAEPQAAAQALVDLANERGGEDNITVGILHLEQRDHAVPPDVPGIGVKDDSAAATGGDGQRGDPVTTDESIGPKALSRTAAPAAASRSGRSRQLLALVLLAECLAVALLLALIRYT